MPSHCFYNRAALAFAIGSTALGCGAAAGPADEVGGAAIASPVAPQGPVRAADSVLDASGVNTKFYHDTTVYGLNPGGTWDNTDAVIAHVLAWGGRTIREHVGETDPERARQRRAMPRLAAAGIRWHVTIGSLADVTRFGGDAAQVRAFAQGRVADELNELVTYYPAKSPGMDLKHLVHSLAGPNEVDNIGRNGAYWAHNARIFQEELWTQAHLLPALSGIPIAAPSTLTALPAEGDRAAELAGPGNILQSWCDRGNPHLYQSGRSPTRSIDAMLEAIQPISGDYPTIFSESGYNNAGYNGAGAYVGGHEKLTADPVPEWVSAVYAPRALADFVRRGVMDMRFELLDDPDITQTDRESHFGLIRMTKATVGEATPGTWVRKPEFYAMRRLHNLLRDEGPPFTPAALAHSVSAPADAALQRLLVQKRDGRHYLLLWRDVDVFRPDPQNAGTELAVDPRAIEIRLHDASRVNVYQPNEATSQRPGGGEALSVPIRGALDVPAGAGFSVQLAGDLKVVEIIAH